MTLPEIVLFGDRSMFNNLELELDVSFQPLDTTTADGLTMRSWIHAAEAGKPLIVYFPGRLGDITRHPVHLFDLTKQGYGLVLAGYRGFGGNPGYPTEHLLYADADGLMRDLVDRGHAPGGLVLYGYSMGTGIASEVATRVRALALVLEAPFTSFPDAVRQQAWQVPSWMVRTQLDTSSRIAAITMPILLMAGGKDSITPPAFAEKLAGLSSKFSKVHVFPNANHVNLMRHGGRETLSSFLVGL